MRVRSRVVCGAATLMALAGLAVGLVSSSASARSQAVNQKVIVVFKNQDRTHPAGRSSLARRRSSFRATQAPILSQLHATRAKHIKSYTVLDAVSATVTPSEKAALKANSAVKEVVPDQFIHLTPSPAATPTSALSIGKPVGSKRNVAPGGGGEPTSKVCSSTQAQLNPQALGLIHADSGSSTPYTARHLGITGAGVKVAFIADGLDINNPDFIRPDGSHVFVDYKDFTGEGTNVPTGGEEAFGDASSVAAQGNKTYDVSGFGPHASTTQCKIKVEGVAPGASLVGLDVFGAEDGGYNSSFLNAINYAVTTAHVNVLNESLGENFYPDDQATLDVIKQANDAAVAAGVTVTASSGDAGVTSTIGSPSTDPNVISTGATTSYRIDAQTGYGGAQFPGIRGYLDNNISSFSSGGFEQDGRTVDVVAPGELNWALCSTDTQMYDECVNYAGKPAPVIPFGGTSESAPLTAGVAALVDEAYQKTHGTYPSPAVVKQIITSSADDELAPADQQGAGMVDAYKAVLAAQSYHAPASSGTNIGTTLLKSTGQLNVTGTPGSQHTLTDTITNNGGTVEHLNLSTRTIGSYQSVSRQTVDLSDANSQKTTDWSGVQSNYEKVTFTVPNGEDRLNAQIAFQNRSATDLDARVRLTLVDPQGDLADYSVPQGDGNYGDSQITEPRPGKWTAYIWSKTSANGGTTGPVKFGASVAKFAGLGAVSPSQMTLQPGESKPIHLHITNSPTPGDQAGAIKIDGSSKLKFGNATTIPVTVRTLIPNGNQTFQQAVTGGNGRSTITGQTFYYQLDVGANQPELNATVKLADNPNNPFTAFLVGPNGEAQAIAANELANGDGTYTNQLGAQLHVLKPAQGTWTLIVAFIPQVSGTALSEPFTVRTSQSAVPASATGLPDSASTQLAANKPVTATVKVTNNNQTPEEFFLDPRLNTSTTLNLAALAGPGSEATTVPMRAGNNIPVYLVPTNTTAFNETASTTGSVPIEFDSQSPAGDPDIESTVGSTATSMFSANPISQGLWDIAPDVTGAYGPTGTADEPVTTSMSVTTAAFDPAITSGTGDLWDASTDASKLGTNSPVTVAPGQSAEIPVTITPTGASGTTVSGTLYVDDESDLIFQNYYEPSGDQVAAIPYQYTIK